MHGPARGQVASTEADNLFNEFYLKLKAGGIEVLRIIEEEGFRTDPILSVEILEEEFSSIKGEIRNVIKK